MSMLSTRVFPFAIVFVLSILFFSSCKKTDSLNPPNTGIEKLISPSQSLPSYLRKINETLVTQNEKKEFLNVFKKNEGLPIWEKSFALINKTNSNARGSLVNDTVVIVPLVRENTRIVGSFLICLVRPDTVLVKIIRGRQYKQFGFSKKTDSLTADNVATQLMYLQGRVFGDSIFKITDDRLCNYKSRKGLIIKPKFVTIRSQDEVTQGKLIPLSYVRCYFIGYDGDQGQVIGVEPGGQNNYSNSEYVCYSSTIWIDDGSGGGWSSGGSTGGGGGSGGSGNTDPYTDPCPPLKTSNSINRESREIPCGDELGWVPVPVPIPVNEPPYVCNYTLTQHEQDVFSQLDQEDAISNDALQNKDCQGTKRAGNINFQGTKEHWLIQLDYISENPVFGDREFAIPGSSITTPGNRGYADLVNLQNGNMFEIKPNNLRGTTDGELEVANYIVKANLNCSGTLPIPAIWNAGTAYATKYIPTGTSGLYLQSSIGVPGVILYNYIYTNNPVPAPVTVPQSVLDKFKNLIDRLRQNFNDADRIMGEFMRQNPELLTYIKNAAIGAGIAIIVGTILEDIITAGVGIADDWACFVMAWRIIRFGMAL